MEKDIEIGTKTFRFKGHDDVYLSHISGDSHKSLYDYARTILTPESIVLDVGANIGFTTAIFSQASQNCQVYSLEPGRFNFELLQTNIKNNGLRNVRTLNLAAGNLDSELNFKENSAWGYLLPSVNMEDHGFESVRVVRLDSLSKTLQLKKIDLIKIDVEGFEASVFEGMHQLIKEFNPKIIFEFNSFCMLAYGNSNPLSFLQYIDVEFKEKFVFRKNQGTDSPILERAVADDFARYYLAQNILRNGSVDDFLVYN